MLTSHTEGPNAGRSVGTHWFRPRWTVADSDEQAIAATPE